MMLKDPINDFQIPSDWINKVKIPLDELEKGVGQGLYVVLSDGEILRRGFTTGTVAAAAAKASVLSLVSDVRNVSVPTPSGIRVYLDINASMGKAEALKRISDHKSDVTGGLVIAARAKASRSIQLKAGVGIGIVTKPGFQVKVGDPAINPQPKRQIMEAIQEALDVVGFDGAEVTISVPEGNAAGHKTLNPAFGIKGGISILGTTGFVEPWNDHLGETKLELIKNASRVILTTGRIGMRYSKLLFPQYTAVMIGSRIDEGVGSLKNDTIICGLPGLILKWAVPDILEGTGFNTVQEMIDNDRENPLIDSALSKAVNKSDGARIVLVDRRGTVIRDTG
jgi:cobalt-precorrin-5B (C1)-methyltransferase